MIGADGIQTHPAFGFMVIALTIIVAPLIAQRLRLPGLVGLLFGGALIGPNLLSVLPNFSGLESIGEIGVLYLIFLAGLGLDLKTFTEYRKVAVVFGLLTAFLPWAMGTGFAAWDGFNFKTALLIGSFWASFTLVSYEVVPKFRLTRNPSMAATVAASSITDTIGLVALAVIVGTETSDDRGSVLVVKIAVGLVALAAYCMILLPLVTRWFFAGLGQERQLRFMLALAGFTSAAVVAEVLGIEGLIGAFFAGLGLNRLIPNRSALMSRIEFFGNSLFIPAFLVSVGLLVDPDVMFNIETLRLALGFAAALLVGKFLAAGIAGGVYRFSIAEVGLMFSLSSAQAAATLASTIIGLEIGLYDDVVVNAVMIVIVLSLVVSAAGSEYFAPRVEPARTGERRLGEDIVVPVIDPEADSSHSLWLAGRIAESDGGVLAPVVVAVATRSSDVTHHHGVLDSIRASLGRLGLTGDPEFRVATSVSGGVDRFMTERQASMVILTWTSHNRFRSAILGGTNTEIASMTPIPVAVAAMTRHEFARVVVHIDNSDLTPAHVLDAKMAVDVATMICESSKMQLVIGPATPEALFEAEIAIPVETVTLGEDSNPRSTLDHLTEDDLLIVPTSADPMATVQRLARDDRSVVTVTRYQQKVGFSEGAVSVPIPPQ